MRSKLLAVVGFGLMFAGIIALGALDIWLAGQAGMAVPSADRPLSIILRHTTVYVDDSVWWLRQLLHAPILIGLAIGMWGGWPDAVEQDPE